MSSYDIVPGGQEAAAPKTRRPLVLALVLVLVVGMAGGAAWWFLGGPADSDQIDVAAPVPSNAAAAETDLGVADGDVELVALPAATYEIFLARDPFEPVVPEDVPSAEGGSATPVADAGDSTNTDDGNGATDPSDADPDSGDPDATGSGCTRQGEVVCDGRVVSLVDVTTGADGEAVAAVQVDTTIYEVVAGQTFAGSFQLRAIDGQCVSLLHGDDGFQLCAGDRVLK